MSITYSKEVDTKWQKIWEERELYKFKPDSDKEKVYLMEMFSYPSGAKLHIGHWWNFGLSDIWGRMKRMQGYNVFHPFGFDAFGLPAENYAIKTGIHPKDSTKANIKTMEEQFRKMGTTYDWDYEVKTCEPEYYKWTQWLFLQLYHKGLAYQKEAPVNWCPSCKTVLANEQVKGGICERCDSPVIQKNLTQWFFKITAYADELLEGLDPLNWPEKAKSIQRNWIGKNSETEPTYRLRDWLVSRQRYWGAPIPIIYCEACGIVPVPEKDLPVELPYDVKFMPNGKSPLAYCDEFVNTTCPCCGAPAKREIDTLDTFVCSSWYYLRYTDPKNSEQPWDLSKKTNLMPVDKYVGGIEHAAMHLLYARFIYKALRDMGYVERNEPFLSLVHQGIILGPDGQKMSKSRGNTISPDDYINKYGSDVFRTYLAFGFSYMEGGPWSDEGIKAVKNFYDKICRMIENYKNLPMHHMQGPDAKLEAIRHKTIKAVTNDIEKFQFNTAVARLTEFRGAISKYQNSNKRCSSYERGIIIDFIKLFAPFAPHFTEEIWESIGEQDSILNQKWPVFDITKMKNEAIEIVVQINNKIKCKTVVSGNSNEEEMKSAALQCNEIRKEILDKKICKIICIKGRLVNIVI